MGLDLTLLVITPVRSRSGHLASSSNIPCLSLRGAPACAALLCCLFALFSPALGSPEPRSVILSWDANTETDIAGYKLRYGTTSGLYDQTLDVGNTTTATISNLANDTAYYFVVSAYNSAGLEGPPSDEAIVLSNNANLSSLTLSAGALTPGFASGTVSYAITAPYPTASLFIIPTPADDAATVTVNGLPAASAAASADIPLDIGGNIITAAITARNGTTTKTYTIAVTRLNPQETWRQNYFGIVANTGVASDSATPQNDGVTNLMKFATAMDPTRPGAMPGTLAKSNNDSLFFTYTRNKAAISAGLKIAVEWSDDLAAGSWSRTGVGETSVDQGATEMVTATVPAGTSGRRFVHLVAMRP